MTEFNGFQARMQFTPIPNPVFSSLMPQITDIVELKVLLITFALIYPKKGSLRYVTFNELLSHTDLIDNRRGTEENQLKKALKNLEKKQAIVHLTSNDGDKQEDIYFINNESSRTAVERIKSGEIALPGVKYETHIPEVGETGSDIFTLYEQNIGMLTPLIADELKEAQKEYPESWIKDAIKESVTQNKRSWRYISRILEHWSTEGKDDGTHRGNLKKNTDPDKFIKGKYGHMVQR